MALLAQTISAEYWLFQIITRIKNIQIKLQTAFPIVLEW